MIFSWKGKDDALDGVATYSTNDNVYEVWMPSFRKASDLDKVLHDIFAEGRRLGHMEMMRGVSEVMNTVARSDLK